jgi:hypothetical protein
MYASLGCAAIDATRQKLKQKRNMKMRKAFIITIGLTSFGAVARMQPASAAQTCKTVCDQSEMHNGKLRCFSAHQECAKKESAGSSTSVQKNKKMD